MIADADARPPERASTVQDATDAPTPAEVADGPRVSRASAARVLWWLSTVLVAGVLPLMMIVSNRSSAAILAAAAAAAVAAMAASKDRRGLAPSVQQARARARGPIALIFLAFLAWAHLSIAWSVRPGLSAFELYGALVPVAAAAVLAVLWVPRAPTWTAAVLAGSLMIAMIAAWVELKGQFPLTRLLGKRLDPADFNRPSLTLLILFWPLVAILRACGRPALAAMACVPMAVLVVVSHSGTVVVAFGLSLCAYAAASLAPRFCIAVAATSTVVAFAAAPWIGDIAKRVVPSDLLGVAQALPAHGFHAKERIEDWSSYGAAVMMRPFVGSGFGASRWMMDEPFTRLIPAPLQAGLANPHPHEMYLQVWVELGFVGAVLAVALVLAGLRRLARAPRTTIPARFALAAAALCMAGFSHGAWQAWWIAALGAAWLLFNHADLLNPRLRERARRPPID